MISRRWKTLAALAVIVASIAQHSTSVKAGGADPSWLVWRSWGDPADPDGFAAGKLGVVHPQMARRYLVQAYRVVSGHGPLPTRDNDPGQRDVASASDAGADWLNASERALGIKTAESGRAWRWFRSDKDLPDNASFTNCPADALATAVKTLEARTAQFGAQSDYVRNWTQGQADVFANCESATLKLPEAVPANADPLLRADRAYQTAAAYFYATDYDAAANRFRAIAADARSPWRIYGRYLAARSLLRKATIHGADTMPAARKEFEAILDDASLGAVHASARGLIDYIDVRRQADVVLKSLGEQLMTSGARPGQLDEYTAVMDRVVGNTWDYAYATVPNVERIRAQDLTDWITAYQGSGPEAVERAALRWKATKSLPWLIALLSKIEGPHADAAAAIDAAARVPADAPAYQTLLVERVRAMAAIGRRADAKAILATLPMRSTATLQKETVNELHVLRRQLADGYGEFWRSTPREVVDVIRTYRRVMKDGVERPEAVDVPTANRPIFDRESVAIINDHLPLSQLVEATVSPELPDHLRRRLAAAVFTRALMLGRHDDAIRVAPVLARLSPALAPAIKAYQSAASGKPRDRAALMLVLRTPALDVKVSAPETSESYLMDNPSLEAPPYRRQWWCAARATEAPAPSFVPAADIAARKDEQRIYQAGPGLQHFGAAVIEWSRQEPKNPLVAEALSRFVNGWRRTCTWDADQSPAPKLAFEMLHRQFPGSEWAKRTPFWYR